MSTIELMTLGTAALKLFRRDKGNTKVGDLLDVAFRNSTTVKRLCNQYKDYKAGVDTPQELIAIFNLIESILV